ncbi:MAG: YfcE family phosphodiesterase, partial [Steroidobacteraceae bacterium]
MTRIPEANVRIGVVSDTHNHLRNVRRIVELFNAAAVDRVIHTGDITQAKTLEVFAGLEAELFGVFGNNDLERDALEDAARRLGIRLADPPLSISWAGRRLLVVHDPHFLDAEVVSDHDVVLHGHTH